MRAAAFRFTASALAALLIGSLGGLTRDAHGAGPASNREGGYRADLGSYMAGRVARGMHDTAAASEFYRRALDSDPGNEVLLDQALLMSLAEGDFPAALAQAKAMAAARPEHRFAGLVLGAQAMKDRRFDAAHEHFKSSALGLMGEVTTVLARAWVTLAQGDMKGATQLLDSVRQADWAQFYLRYHKALISDVGGRTQEAAAHYERLFRNDARSLRITLAYARHAAANGDKRLARNIIAEHVKRTSGNVHPMAQGLLNSLDSGEDIKLLVDNPVSGLAEVFYGLGEALSSEGSVSVGAVYLQLSLLLEPHSPFALAALATVYETTKRYETAIDVYRRIPEGTPLQTSIDIRRALILDRLDRLDEAKVLLEKMAHDNPRDLRALDALGNIMRGRKLYDDAIGYYTRLIATIGKPGKKHWTHFYARGTAYERTKRWPQAEADLVKALQLSPDQPSVLNYLGYSWVDQSKNLKQGLAYIEKAVRLRPDDGHIVDSLGWAHFRLGNFKEAARYLERAVELMPQDPILNDHLGDALWRVGRQDEARFQWSQALTLKPEAEDAEKIKAKLAAGLPPRVQGKVVRRTKQATRREAQRKKRTDNQSQPYRPFE